MRFDTLYQLGIEKIREVAYEEDGPASGRAGRRCHVLIQGAENLNE